jgi:TPR repeat protein
MPTVPRVAPVLLLALALALDHRPAAAGEPDYQAGLEAYRAGDEARALAIWLPLAEKGDFRAANGAGLVLKDGPKGLRDHGEAIRWLERAAEGGSRSAPYNLGLLHAKSDTHRDLPKAYTWMYVAEKRGDPDAVELRKAVGEALDFATRARAAAAAQTWLEANPAGGTAHSGTRLP